MAEPDFPITFYHNPACGTSRNALAMVQSVGYAPTIVEYLQTGWRRDQLEDFNFRRNLPAVRGRALAQLLFGFRQRDVERAFAELGALDQELQRDGGLARPRRAFQKKNRIHGKNPAGKRSFDLNIVGRGLLNRRRSASAAKTHCIDRRTKIACLSRNVLRKERDFASGRQPAQRGIEEQGVGVERGAFRKFSHRDLDW